MTAAIPTEIQSKPSIKPPGELPPPTAGAAIEVQNIVKVYGSLMAVKDVSFSVK